MAAGDTEPGWREIASKKRQSVLDLIPPEWRLDSKSIGGASETDLSGSFLDQFLSAAEIAVTHADPCTIVDNISSGEWLSLDVAHAFAHRAALAHQFLPCLHEICFDDAFADAKRLDEYYKRNKRTMGPLHGLPVSLKDQFHVRGLDTSMGYVGWLSSFEGKKGTGKERVYESELVRELRELGAVIYCKTSVPQTLMAGETFNNIIGYLWNPRNRKLSSGGSSGGEGVLISMKGSPLGFGTDIAGSVRVPAAFNGLYGLRTSSGRLPYQGAANSMKGQISARSVVGPISPTVSGVRLAVKSVLSQQPWLHDPMVHPIPWRDADEVAIQQKAARKDGKRLALGLVLDDGLARPYPTVQRALKVVKERLEAEGHKVIMWDTRLLPQAAMALKSWFFDGGEDIHKAFALSGEDILPQIQGLYGQKPLPQMTGGQIADFNLDHAELQKAFLDLWAASAERTGTGEPVDAIIAPTATNHAATPMMHIHPIYNLWPSCFDSSACHIPVLEGDSAVDVYDPQVPSLGEADDKVRATYDPKLFHGISAGVQVVGRRLDEEKVIAISQYLEDILRVPGRK